MPLWPSTAMQDSPCTKQTHGESVLPGQQALLASMRPGVGKLANGFLQGPLGKLLQNREATLQMETEAFKKRS